MEPTYHLEGVIHTKEEMKDFEGPLNLILMLLSKNKIEIRDIQVSEILEQYLEYLKVMEDMDLEVASEFVQMASHLLYIKTRMLLTSEEEVDELELLISSLEQLKAKDVYASLKKVCPELSKLYMVGSLCCTKLPEPLKGVKEYRYSHESWELLKAISDLNSRARTDSDGGEGDESAARRRIVPKRIVYDVRSKSREILLRLKSKGGISLREFYGSTQSRSEVVATFISILELCSLGHTHLEREQDEIIVTFTGGDVEQIMESVEQFG